MVRSSQSGRSRKEPQPYEAVARGIGTRLRQIYRSPEADALPTEHVDLLLKLRHKERDISRSRN